MFNNNFKFNPKSLFLITMVVFCAGAGLFAVNVGIANATDYYVSTTGDNSDTGLSTSHAWATPSFAAQQAVAGDTIYLIDDLDNPDDGTWYDEHITFANSGTEGNPITMTAYSGTPTLDGVTPDGNDSAILTKTYYGEPHGYININGLKILNYYYGCNLYSGSYHINISDCDIYTKQYCIRAENPGSHDIHVDNCILRSTDWNALGAWGIEADNIMFSNCTSLLAGWNGQFINNAKNSIIVNGKATMADHNGIQLSNTTNCVVKNCSVYDSTGSNGFYIANGVFNSIIEDCKANNVYGRGIVVDIAGDVTIRRWHSWDNNGEDIHILRV